MVFFTKQNAIVYEGTDINICPDAQGRNFDKSQLTCVTAHVDFEVDLLCEALGAHGTLVLPLSTVYQHVPVETARLAELLEAFGTLQQGELHSKLNCTCITISLCELKS